MSCGRGSNRPTRRLIIPTTNCFTRGLVGFIFFSRTPIGSTEKNVCKRRRCLYEKFKPCATSSAPLTQSRCVGIVPVLFFSKVCRMIYDFLNSSFVVRLTRGLSKRVSFPLFYEATLWDKPAFVLSFDVDFRRDVAALPQVCSMLSQFRVPASFACIGTWVSEFPEEHVLLIEKGHEIFNHSMRHPDNGELDRRRWNDLSLDEQRLEIKEAHETIADVCGVEPKGFRMPHFGPQHRWHVYDLLEGLGYAYSSSTTCGGDYGFCRPLKVKEMELLEFPTATIPGMGYASFDSFNYFNKKRPFAEQGCCMPMDFQALLERVVREKLLGTLYFDPYDFVARPEYREILKTLSSFHKNIALCRYRDVLKMRAADLV